MKKWLFAFIMLAQTAAAVLPTHGIAMHGDLKYPPDFKHFNYVNPDAPKGGTLKQATFGSFDTLNPFTMMGNAAPSLGLLFDTLTVESLDEPFSQYGLVAQSIEMPEDRSWVAFNINPRARFHDGTPMTAQDVVFTFYALKEKGAPTYRSYFADVKDVTATSPLRVLFTFHKGVNRELPLIIGQMPVLSQKDWAGKDFAATTMTPPLGSGAYQIKEVAPNRFISYERVKNYWAKDLPVVRGQYNFDEIRYDVYRDTTVAVEALKAGAFDVRLENESKKWATAYKGTNLIKKEFSQHLPSGMQGFVFNTRRPIFADKRVRQALSLALDFKWLNEHLFYAAYTRTHSYFDNSELASSRAPKLPIIKDGNMRPQLSQALDLLAQAGWTVQEGVLKNAEGQPFTFEILLDAAGAPAWERIVLPYVHNLKKLGIVPTVRVMDVLQYKNRLDSFDFDMIVFVWGQSLSPGNEQRYFWGSKAADIAGSYNMAGIKNKKIDRLIERIISSKTRPDLIRATQALDDALLAGYYVVPHWHITTTRMVFWDKFGYPKQAPIKGISLMTWWAK